jgi:tetratricopeptide (TPR) repeat protein
LVCLGVWPIDPAVLRRAARAARRARVYGDAEISLEKYQQVRGLDEASSLEALLLSAERDIDAVADACRRRVDENRPEAPLVLEAAADGYLRQFRIPEARVCVDRWSKIEPENAQVFSLQGRLHLDYEHDPAAAAESYRRALQLDPEHEEAHLGLALASLQRKDYAGAAEHLEYLRHCQPDNLRVQVGLADCRDALNDRAEATRLVDGVLAQEPQYAPALALRGHLAMEEGDYPAAETWLRQAVALDPSNHQARYNLILCLSCNDKPGEAQVEGRRLRQWEADLERFQEITTHEMAQRPHDPALHYTLGQLLLRSGDRREGLRWLHSALREDPQYAPARQALAELQQQAAAGQEHQD